MIYSSSARRRDWLMIPVLLAITATTPASADAQDAAACAAPRAAPAKPKKKLGLGGLLKTVRDAGVTEVLPSGSAGRAAQLAESAVTVAGGGNPAAAVAGATGSDRAGRAAGVVSNLARQADQGC